jgi:hypothetical protein
MHHILLIRQMSSDSTVLGTEKIIWHNEITKGIFNKHVIGTQRVTNYRVVYNSSEILLKDVDDILVMNQRRISQSQYMGTSSGRYTRFGAGSSRSKSVTIGDVVFMYRGAPYIIFNQITDPSGVVRLAKAARKQILSAVLINEKQKIQSQKMQEDRQKRERAINATVSSSTTSVNVGMIVCPRCSSTNEKGSKYCNNCGFRLIDIKEKITADANQLKSSNAFPPQSPNTYMINEFTTCDLLSSGIKIDYPSTWNKIEEGLGPSLVVAFRSSKENASDTFLESAGIAVRTVPPQLTLQQFMQLNIADLKKKHQDFRLLEQNNATLGGRMAQKILYYESGFDTLYIVTIKQNVTMKDNTAYQFMFRAKPEKYSSYLPTVQRMINSFKFID